MSHRINDRKNNELRKIKIYRDYIKHGDGSVLIECGDTKVICSARIVGGVPRFLKNQNQGWLTCEYGMLPQATHERSDREATRGKQNARSQEIQRLIGRALRNVIDLKELQENTIIIDCDVIQADGGTRCASITGGCVALVDAINQACRRNIFKKNPLKGLIAAVSVGIVDGLILVDLDYKEDSRAQTDMNIVMDENGNFVEIQGTAENGNFNRIELQNMINMAESAIREIIAQQKHVLKIT